MFLKSQLIFPFLLTIVIACDTRFPNGTDARPNWWDCGSGDAVKYFNATPFYPAGGYEYPIHLGQPLLVISDIDNQDHVFEVGSLKTEINIWSWGGLLTCDWHALPTLGLLANLDACTHGVPCPVPTGRQNLAVTIDFTPYSMIINLLKDDAPYQLQYILTEKGEQVSCLMFQSRARIHK